MNGFPHTTTAQTQRLRLLSVCKGISPMSNVREKPHSNQGRAGATDEARQAWRNTGPAIQHAGRASNPACSGEQLAIQPVRERKRERNHEQKERI